MAVSHPVFNLVLINQTKVLDTSICFFFFFTLVISDQLFLRKFVFDVCMFCVKAHFVDFGEFYGFMTFSAE